MKQVIVLIGAGSIGQAIARRVGAGKHVLLADLRQDNAEAAAKTLGDAGFDVSTATVDVSARPSVQAVVATAVGIGEIAGLIHAAGVSPTQASPAAILKVDLYGTALVLDQIGDVIAPGGAGLVIASPCPHLRATERGVRRSRPAACNSRRFGGPKSLPPCARTRIACSLFAIPLQVSSFRAQGCRGAAAHQSKRIACKTGWIRPDSYRRTGRRHFSD